MKRFYKILIGLFIVFIAMAGCGKMWEAYNANHPSGSNKYYEMLTGLSEQESIYMKLGEHEVKDL